MTALLIFAAAVLAAVGWWAYRKDGWPGVAAAVAAATGAALALLGASGRKRVPTAPPPAESSPVRAVSRTAGQIIEGRERKAREAVAAADEPEDVAAIMRDQK